MFTAKSLALFVLILMGPAAKGGLAVENRQSIRKARTNHRTDFFIVKTETALYVSANGAMQAVVKLPKKSVLTSSAPPANRGVPKNFEFVTFSAENLLN